MPVISDRLSWLLWLCCLVVGVVALLLDVRERHQWLSPRRWFGIGFCVLYVLAPFDMLWRGNRWFSLSTFPAMAFASALGGIAFLGGWGARHARPQKIARGVAGATPTYALQALLLSPVAFAALFYAVRSYGGLRELFYASGSPMVYIDQSWYSVFSVGVATLLVLALVWSGRLLRWRRWWVLPWAPFVVMLYALYILIALRLGSRYRLLFMALPMLALWLATHKRLSQWVPIVVCCGFGLFYFAFGRIRVDLVLRPDVIIRQLAEYFSKGIYTDLLTAGDFDAFQNGALLLGVVPRYRPWMWGATLLSVLYNPIPRLFWPAKPSPAPGQYLIELGLGPSIVGHNNFAVSLIAELYANFSWFGVFVGMWVLGLISRRMWEWFSQNRHRQEAWLHIGLFCAYLPLVLRGSFHSMTVYYLMVALAELLSRKLSAVIWALAPHTYRVRLRQSIVPKDDRHDKARCVV